MSIFLSEDYIKLLLTTPSRTQCIALLDTCTDQQIDSLGDIAKNLLHLPLSPQARIIVSKRKTLLQKLSQETLSYREKSLFIGKHYRIIIDVLKAVKTPILKLLAARHEKASSHSI